MVGRSSAFPLPACELTPVITFTSIRAAQGSAKAWSPTVRCRTVLRHVALLHEAQLSPVSCAGG
eukprot:11197067-Alexandrium_andersonii.AAC.1